MSRFYPCSKCQWYEPMKCGVRHIMIHDPLVTTCQHFKLKVRGPKDADTTWYKGVPTK